MNQMFFKLLEKHTANQGMALLLCRMRLASSLQVNMDTDLYVNVDAYQKPQLHNNSIDSMILKSGSKHEVRR